MMIDQAGVVATKLTHIDRLKGGDGAAAGVAGVLEVFGIGARGVGATRFRPDWLSPFAKACFPASVQDQVMGFCRPCRKKPENSNVHIQTELASSSNMMVRSGTEIV